MEGFSREQASVKRVLLLYLLFSWSSKGDFASLLPASGGSNSPNSSNLTPYRRAELSQLSWSAAHVVYLGFLKEDGCLDSNLIAEGEEVGSEDDENVSIDANNEKTWQEYGGEKGSAESLKPEGYNFDTCPPEMRDYIPCLDNVAAIKSLQSTAKGEKWERHCPQGKSRLCCLIPAPKGYKSPIRWPKSRDEVWYNNVPHTRLVADKGGQNWIAIAKDKFKFPGGGTQFAHGADQYLDQMSQMLPDLKFGTHVRVALDIGCGVASWGAYLLARGVLTLSIAPKDVHENQIQFALERGIPAMIAVLATHRLLYPSQAFDLIHCSRCRIEWTRDDGVLLLEVDRVLKAGGYFAWAAQPVYKHEESNQRTWLDMEDLATRMCWKLVAKQGYIAIWQKPIDKSCYSNRLPGALPTLCDINEDPDSVWYVTLKACITLPRNNPDKFFWLDYPARLDNPPVRLQSLHIDAIASKNEVFEADRRYWIEIVQGYLRGLSLKIEDIRNVMDMRACYGGFAAALADQKVDWWVMNVVPISGINTLPIIYDRGLIGVAHDWCEPFDTYPRTYDLLHVHGLFTLEQDRCNIAHIILEMDRILRPGGWVLIRESMAMALSVEVLAKSVRWKTHLLDTENGPFGKDKLLSCQKVPWHG